MSLNLFIPLIPLNSTIEIANQSEIIWYFCGKFLTIAFPWICAPLPISDNPSFVQCGEESPRLNHQEVPVLRGTLLVCLSVYGCGVFGLTHENEKDIQPKVAH
jgi:hypothetical protein